MLLCVFLCVAHGMQTKKGYINKTINPHLEYKVKIELN